MDNHDTQENNQPDYEDYNISLLIITTATILLQCYVIFIIIYVSPKSMSDFRYFLCLISIWDLIFTVLLGYGLHPMFLFPIGGAQINGFFKHLGPTGANTGFCMIIFAAVNVFNAQMFCFLFRVTVLVPNPKVHEWFMKPVSLILSQIYWMALSLAYAIPLYLILLKDKTLVTFVTNFSKAVNLPPPKPDAVVIAVDFDPNLPIGINTRRYCAAVVGGVLYFEILCLSMTIYIIRRLRKNVHLFSKKTYSLQIQFTLVLAFQLISPLIFILVPVSVVLINGMIGMSRFDHSAGKTGTVLLSIYTLSNSLVTVLFVTPYRKYTLDKFGICFGRRFREFVIRNSQLIRPKVAGLRLNTASVAPVRALYSSDHNMDEDYSITLLVITAATIFLQSYLIYIIIFVSPKSMSEFRYFLCSVSVWDLLFTAMLGYGLHPVILFPVSAGQFNGFVKYFGPLGANIGFCLIIFVAVNVITAQFLCLFYRFTTVLPNQTIHEYFMKPINMLTVQIYAIILASGYSVPLYFLLLKDKALSEYVEGSSEFFKSPLPEPNAIIVAVIFNSGSFDLNSTTWYAIAIVVGFVTLESLSFGMTYYTIKTLRKNAHLFSRKTYALQIQFTLVLAFQLVSPILFILTPISYVWVRAVTGGASIDRIHRSSGAIGIVLLSIYTLSNSVVTVLFVTPYRKYTLAKFGICFGRKFREFMNRNSQLTRLKVSGMRRNTASVIPANSDVSYVPNVSPRLQY